MFQNFRNLTSNQIESFLTLYTSETIELYDKLSKLDDSTLSWESFIVPQLNLDIKFAYHVQILNMDDFHPSEEIRTTCNKVSTEYQKFMIDQESRRDVFAKFKYYYENQFQVEKELFSEERVKYVEDKWINYLHQGLNLPDAQFERVKEIQKELAELSSKFSLNLTNENSSYLFSLEQLEGLQESWLASRLQDNSMYKVTLKYPDYLPLMEYCKVRETRKTIAIAFNTRCGDINAQLCSTTYKLRHELAEIFGFDSYANYSLQKKMAKNYNNVMNFLNNLNQNLKPVLANDYAKLYELAQNDGITQLELYDMAYYTRMYKEQQTNLDNDVVRQYFQFDAVTNGIFQIYQQFLSVKFTDITHEHSDELWHESVQLFQVNDAKSENLIGYFYLDAISRDFKYNHAAVFPFVRKSSQTLPICAMACNFTKTQGLTHDDVVTYFHEFGHVMHNVCSDVELLAFGGTQVERDYVETPSQCFERWCYALEPLKILSGGTIPEDVVNKINQQGKLCQGYFYCRQMSFALTDMLIHSTRWNEVPDEVFNSVLKETTDLNPLEGMKFMETFHHPMGGYGSGYYGYMWSEVFCEDLYQTCIKGHELDTEVGLKFRREILQYGGSRDSTIGLVNMLGRLPNDHAFIKSIIG